MDKTYRVTVRYGGYGGKCCLTCEHWDAKREKKPDSLGEAVECSDSYLSGACKLHLGTHRMASTGACRDYAKWHELK